MNFPKIHFFYFGKSGHMKANCWIKKNCNIFAKLKEKEGQKDKRREKKQKKRKRKNKGEKN